MKSDLPFRKGLMVRVAIRKAADALMDKITDEDKRIAWESKS
jgi:hypothetical protein